MGSQVLNEPLPQLRGRPPIERCLLTELGAFAILSSSGSGGCLIHKPLSTSWILLLKLESLVGGNEEELIRRTELAPPTKSIPPVYNDHDQRVRADQRTQTLSQSPETVVAREKRGTRRKS